MKLEEDCMRVLVRIKREEKLIMKICEVMNEKR